MSSGSVATRRSPVCGTLAHAKGFKCLEFDSKTFRSSFFWIATHFRPTRTDHSSSATLSCVCERLVDILPSIWPILLQHYYSVSLVNLANSLEFLGFNLNFNCSFTVTSLLIGSTKFQEPPGASIFSQLSRQNASLSTLSALPLFVCFVYLFSAESSSAVCNSKCAFQNRRSTF